MRISRIAPFIVAAAAALPATARAQASPPDTAQPADSTIAAQPVSSTSASSGQLACAPIKVHFALDSDQLYDSEKPLLDRTAQCLRDNGKQRISIVGNADERGSEAYNQALGQRRAQTVASYLENKGASREQIESVVSHGKDSPICRGSNLKCWQLNRRTAVRESCHL